MKKVKTDPKGKVLVKHTTTYDRFGRPKITSARAVVQKVQHRYMNGRVSTVTGDVWVVKKSDDKRAEFETVAVIEA